MHKEICEGHQIIQIAQASDKSHRDMIASIQKHLGHKSPQMTLHYIQAIDTDLSDELSNLDNLVST